MDAWDELRVERNLLEFRLVMLERAIQEQRGMDAPGLGERMESLFARLRLVNDKLTAIRHGDENGLRS